MCELTRHFHPVLSPSCVAGERFQVGLDRGYPCLQPASSSSAPRARRCGKEKVLDQLTFGTPCIMTKPAEPSLHEQCRYTCKAEAATQFHALIFAGTLYHEDQLYSQRQCHHQRWHGNARINNSHIIAGLFVWIRPRYPQVAATNTTKVPLFCSQAREFQETQTSLMGSLVKPTSTLYTSVDSTPLHFVRAFCLPILIKKPN